MIAPMFTITVDEKSDTFGRFIYEPLNTSFGNSMGNALRRTLLSSLPGAAIGYVKFEQASHLFSTIDGVKESALDIVLNLKQIRFKTDESGPFPIKLSVKGAQKVRAKDFEGPIEIVNGDLYITETTDKNAELTIDAIVEVGYGFQPSEDKENESGFIAIDSSYSPMVRVNFKVEEARVGRKSDFERLIMELWTDGSIDPEEAMKQASTILANHYTSIVEGGNLSVFADSENTEINDQINPKAYETIIDELSLPSRVINALLRENIETVADLVERGRGELTNLKGVGKKSIDLIEEELKKMDIEIL